MSMGGFYYALGWGQRGRVSLLLYAGACMIAIYGLFSSLLIYGELNHLTPPSYLVYAVGFLWIGIALVIVGAARQAQRMLPP